MSSLEKADYECPVKLNTSEREGVNKQNDLKQEFLFLKDPPLNLRESGSKYGLRAYVKSKPIQSSLLCHSKSLRSNQ